MIQFPARVAKLADALDLGSCTLIGVGVRLPPLAFFRMPLDILDWQQLPVIRPGEFFYTHLRLLSATSRGWLMLGSGTSSLTLPRCVQTPCD